MLTIRIDHLVFRVSSLNRTEQFYNVVLSQKPDRTEDSILYVVGDTRLFFTVADEQHTEPHDKENIGLNHLAFGVPTLPALTAVEAHLDANEISHSGVQLDPYGTKEFIWLDDPDAIRLEFYLRSA